ncbi:MAG TPA: hypothetical protein VIV40_36195, partial [Kofleriaceae bacterium]
GASIHAFRAVIAHLHGNDAKAIVELQLAIGLFDQYKMIGPAAAARWQLGRLLGGDEGAALIERSRAWLTASGAARPEHIARLAIPGVGD